MPIFKMIQTPNGFRYFKDKRFIKKTDVPTEVLNQLEVGKDVHDEAQSLKENKHCIFCNMGGCRMTRLVNNKIVYLCEQDFYNNTVGKIAQRVRELETA